ncbi:MAG: peroxidase family protein [Gemmataceae bacterium]
METVTVSRSSVKTQDHRAINRKSHAHGPLLLEHLESRIVPSSGMYQTIDGSGNNLTNPTWGQAETHFLRLSYADYSNGTDSPSGADRPNPRTISNAVVAQGPVSIPSQRGLSTFTFQWGQFVDHDITLADEAHPKEPFPIPIPTGDPYFDPFRTGTVEMALSRSNSEPGDAGIREQVNSITAFIDGSNIYGSDMARANALRSFDGGKLKTQTTPVGELMIFNFKPEGSDEFFPNASSDRAPDPSQLFLAGDPRSNEQLGLTAMHTLWVREHNRQADLLAEQHPTWNDEQLYHGARRIVIAELQAITYNEFLPAILGPNSYLGEYIGYDSTVNPGLSNEFSSAAYRVGHTMLPLELFRVDAAGNPIAEGHLALRDAFFRPDRLFTEGGIEPLLHGLAAQPQQEIDRFVVDEVRNFLFGPPGAGGFDLASLNIQRGREHGMPTLNEVRSSLGLERFRSFADISSDFQTWSALAGVYDSVDDIDLWVGGLAEDHLPGSSLGETFTALWVDQFARLRDGDRFYYENDLFTQDQLNTIENTLLADIIRENSAIPPNIQDEVFRDASVFTYRAPAGTGPADVSLQVTGGTIKVTNTTTGEEVLRPLAGTSRVVLFGTNQDDAFQIELGRLAQPLPVEVFTRGGTNDTVKVVGTDSFDSIVVDEAVVHVMGTHQITHGADQIKVDGAGGTDILTAKDDVSAQIWLEGGAGLDFIRGANNSEVLSGGAGMDFIYGFAGDDILIGGAGRDFLFGGDGDDLLIGGMVMGEELMLWAMAEAFQADEDLVEFLTPQNFQNDLAFDFLMGGFGKDLAPMLQTWDLPVTM